MLITIAVEELLVGMHVHSIDLPWYSHPFWSRHFTLRNNGEIAALIDAGASRIVIDDSKGIGLPAGVAPPPALSVIASRPAPATSAADSYRASPSPPLERGNRLLGKARTTEIRRASKILSRSKKAVMNMFDDARMGKAVKTKGIGNLVEQISTSVSKDPTIILNVARLKTKDEYTFLHSVSVCALMINLSRKLGLDEAVVHEMGMAGMLHDVGKMAIPDDILNKPERLTDVEMAVVRNHPQRGFEILAASKSVSQTALDVCLSHHEKMDGTGYPNRKNGDDLSLAARMAAICDVYDAVTSQRSYNNPWSAADALRQMISWRGHFDQLLLKAFVESLGILPVGKVVSLSDGTLAIVIGEEKGDFTRPIVRIFYSITAGAALPWCDLQITNDGQTPTINTEVDPATFGIRDWNTLSAKLLEQIEQAPT